MRKQRGRGLIYRYKPIGTVPPILTQALISKWKRKKRRSKKNQKGGFFGFDVKSDGTMSFLGHKIGKTKSRFMKNYVSHY